MKLVDSLPTRKSNNVTTKRRVSSSKKWGEIFIFKCCLFPPTLNKKYYHPFYLRPSPRSCPTPPACSKYG